MKWTDTKDSVPAEHGYYFTYYFNERQQEHLYKAIWWDGDGWVNWKWTPDQNRYIETIERFVEESRNDYYVPCMMWAEERWESRNASS